MVLTQQQRQFFGRPVAVFFGEFHHRVLDDVQGRFIIAYGVHRLLVSAALYLRQKVRQFLGAGQPGLSRKLLCIFNEL